MILHCEAQEVDIETNSTIPAAPSDVSAQICFKPDLLLNAPRDMTHKTNFFLLTERN